MASSPDLRNGKVPSRPTSTSNQTPPTSITEQGVCLVARPAKLHSADAPAIRTVLSRDVFAGSADLAMHVADDPLVGTRGAAIILGVSRDFLKKRRQRGQAPEYYQYEEGGPVRYSVRALTAFKAAHLVTPRKRGRN